MSCGGKYGTARSKIQFVIKTVMTNTVEFTEWSELLNHATNLLRHRIRSYTTGFLERGCGLEADKARGVSILATVP